MKLTPIFKILFLLITVFLNATSFGQKVFNGVEHKYTFQVDTSYWKVAEPKKVARKIKYDKESKGVDTKYEYIFCTNNNEAIDRPCFLMMVYPTAQNGYEETKTKFKQRAQVTLAELDTKFKDHDRTITEAVVDDKRKVIAYSVLNTKAEEPYYSCNITYFQDNYILVYALSVSKEDFKKVYALFSQVALSTKF
jgi:hypothetical protein